MASPAVWTSTPSSSSSSLSRSCRAALQHQAARATPGRFFAGGAGQPLLSKTSWPYYYLEPFIFLLIWGFLDDRRAGCGAGRCWRSASSRSPPRSHSTSTAQRRRGGCIWSACWTSPRWGVCRPRLGPSAAAPQVAPIPGHAAAPLATTPDAASGACHAYPNQPPARLAPGVISGPRAPDYRPTGRRSGAPAARCPLRGQPGSQGQPPDGWGTAADGQPVVHRGEQR